MLSPVILGNGGQGDLSVAFQGWQIHARGKILVVGGKIDNAPGTHDIGHQFEQIRVIPVNIKMIPLASPCKKRGRVHHTNIKSLSGLGCFF